MNGFNIETWYLDRFVYTTPYNQDIEIALRETSAAEEMSVAGQREAFELADKVIVDPGEPIEMVETKPNFFATAEGFYNFRYIYQYKYHLGNTRQNFGRDANNDLFMEDRNDYYPFGLNFINPVGSVSSVFNPSATYRNYKYNGKELQETGMYDYGARMYMADIGRWGVVDPLAETSRRWSTYTYAYNNPIMFIDPDGMQNEGWIPQLIDGKQTVTYDPNVNTTQEAIASGKYEHLNGGVSVTGEINNVNPLTGESSLAYSLNADGSVTDANGGSVAGDFTTPGGIAISGTTGGGWFSSIKDFFTSKSDNFPQLGGGSFQPGNNQFFRRGKDTSSSTGGYFAGMLNSLAFGKLDLNMSFADKLLGAEVNAAGFASLFGGSSTTKALDSLVPITFPIGSKLENGYFRSQDTTMMMKIPTNIDAGYSSHFYNNNNPFARTKIDSIKNSWKK